MNANPAIDELEKIEQDLLAKLKTVQGTLAVLRSMYSNGIPLSVAHHGTLNKYSDYDKNGTLRDKVAFVFKKENRFLHVREIPEILHSLEPKFSVEEWNAKLGPVMAWLKAEKIITKIIVGKSNLNTFWGSNSWLDENGEPKAQHKYDESQVNKSRKGELIDIA